jgi:hypothetical protein
MHRGRQAESHDHQRSGAESDPWPDGDAGGVTGAEGERQAHREKVAAGVVIGERHDTDRDDFEGDRDRPQSVANLCHRRRRFSRLYQRRTRLLGASGSCYCRSRASDRLHAVFFRGSAAVGLLRRRATEAQADDLGQGRVEKVDEFDNRSRPGFFGCRRSSIRSCEHLRGAIQLDTSAAQEQPRHDRQLAGQIRELAVPEATAHRALVRQCLRRRKSPRGNLYF